eukprot:1159890-Pelagomonas_calceolata.AAC.12
MPSPGAKGPLSPQMYFYPVFFTLEETAQAPTTQKQGMQTGIQALESVPLFLSVAETDGVLEPVLLRLVGSNPSTLRSDAQEVIYKRHGLEPAAARLLDQALLFNSASRPLNAPLSKKAAEESRRSTCSFLAALLGPELEAVAKERAQGER